MNFYEFVEFLETGKVAPVEIVSFDDNNNTQQDNNTNVPQTYSDQPVVKDTISPLNYSASLSNLTSGGGSSTNIHNNNKKNPTNLKVDIQGNPVTTGGNNSTGVSLPPFPPSPAPEADIISNETATGLLNKTTTQDDTDDENTRRMNKIKDGYHEGAIVPSKGLHLISMSAGDEFSENAATTATKPLWKKREVVRQERTIHYTTLDATGTMQVS